MFNELDEAVLVIDGAKAWKKYDTHINECNNRLGLSIKHSTKTLKDGTRRTYKYYTSLERRTKAETEQIKAENAATGKKANPYFKDVHHGTTPPPETIVNQLEEYVPFVLFHGDDLLISSQHLEEVKYHASDFFTSSFKCFHLSNMQKMFCHHTKEAILKVED
ncbi:hypothetical protein LHV56_19275 [Peribacillus frigoritolerans]|uniref:hypothetical protein n=1 Tax=Peribacillus frigoritolerans TaxID=450367 RepID=UPI00207A168C|nr:hypothetical protein [Peribacillus frigoritolerans]USK78973.1 hypothetical protein LHV56_19275 [Peribacillus frigoritolerans]